MPIREGACYSCGESLHFKHPTRFSGKSHGYVFREEKTNIKKMSLSFHLSLMSTLTWITGKELEREINNNGDQFRWKKNMKII